MKCRGRCGSCYQRWRYNTNPQWRLTVNQRGKRWRHAHKAQVSRADHKYYLAHKEELAKYERAWHLNKAYGISLQQYQELYDKQNGRCAICRQSFPKLWVDHDHTSKIIRGLLCRDCNLFTGYLENHKSRLAIAQRYLKWK